MAIITMGQITLTNVDDGLNGRGIVDEKFYYALALGNGIPTPPVYNEETKEFELGNSGIWSKDEPAYKQGYKLYYIRCIKYTDDTGEVVGPILSSNYKAIADTNIRVDNANNTANKLMEDLGNYNATFDFAADGLIISATLEEGRAHTSIDIGADKYIHLRYAYGVKTDEEGKIIVKGFSTYYNPDSLYIGVYIGDEYGSSDPQDYAWINMQNGENKVYYDINENAIEKPKFFLENSTTSLPFDPSNENICRLRITYKLFSETQFVETEIFRFKNKNANVYTVYGNNGLEFKDTNGNSLGTVNSDQFLLRNGEIMQGSHLKFGKYRWTYTPVSPTENPLDAVGTSGLFLKFGV